MFKSTVIAVAADDLASFGAKASAATVMTRFEVLLNPLTLDRTLSLLHEIYNALSWQRVSVCWLNITAIEHLCIDYLQTKIK